MPDASPFRYRAFLSYSHRDTAWARWLQAALEGYSVDKDLVGRETLAGPVPRTLRPVFRDREDFSAGHSLTDQTRAALEASQFVVVICSPDAANSQYVNEEIRRYKALGRGGQVIPIIIDGEPGDPERECFPKALRFKVGPDGALTDEREEPIAADARPHGDGKDGATLKLVAGLLGVGLDEIVRRAERARRRRLRNWVAALAVLTATFAGLAGWAEVQRRYAQQALDAGIRTSNSLSVDLATKLRNQRGIQSGLVKYLLDSALVLQDKLGGYGRSTPDLQRGQARALLEISITMATIGDNANAVATAVRAREIIESLLRDKPDDPDWQHNLAVSYERAGDALVAQGKIEEALTAFRKVQTIAQGVVDAHPENRLSREEVAIGLVKIGNVLSYQRMYGEALAQYQMSLAIRQKLVDEEADNANWKRSLAISYERIGDTLLVQGKRDEAVAAFEKRLAITQALADGDPGNTDLQRDLSVAHNKSGDALLAAGNPLGALDEYRKGLAIRQPLADSDPDNTTWRRDLGTSYYKIGTATATAGQFEPALTAFQNARAISQKLAAADQGNAQWQRDVFMTDTMIAKVLQKEGKLDGALDTYRDGLAIAVRLTQAHPGDASWKDAVGYSVNQIGLLSYNLVLAHEFAPALDAVDQAISLAPNLIWLYSNRAHALMFLGRLDEARSLYLRYRGQKNVDAQKSWEAVVLGDFAELRKAGLANPLMDEIEKTFAG